ncbi:unnamed protein product [Arabis nemorensis]|uniref:Uncharacterized protein n=1 Tax=Arabis nemorensis TaxID=586526 RepID=A0A565BV42_9BRAS|nr:unnamed protein product [Arabis nemorensis]
MPFWGQRCFILIKLSHLKATRSSCPSRGGFRQPNALRWWSCGGLGGETSEYFLRDLVGFFSLGFRDGSSLLVHVVAGLESGWWWLGCRRSPRGGGSIEEDSFSSEIYGVAVFSPIPVEFGLIVNCLSSPIPSGIMLNLCPLKGDLPFLQVFFSAGGFR